MRPSAAQRSAQASSDPEQGEEGRPEERGERSSGPRQSIGATTRWRKEEKRSKVANWSETMQWKTLDSLASVERPVLHLWREQFASTQRYRGAHSNRCFRLLHLVNGAQCRQLFVVKCAGGYSDVGKDARVYCVASCEPIREPASLLACRETELMRAQR